MRNVSVHTLFVILLIITIVSFALVIVSEILSKNKTSKKLIPIFSVTTLIFGILSVGFIEFL